MTSVWILTLIMYGNIHHYADNGVFATKDECETVLTVMQASNPWDENTAHNTICREILVDDRREK